MFGDIFLGFLKGLYDLLSAWKKIISKLMMLFLIGT